ncbi:MAG: SHOCT domain-containing protein [Peptococcaceae bacterium]|nr:SHOCT domain-containing protein [Peptococcaceae bacterium]
MMGGYGYGPGFGGHFMGGGIGIIGMLFQLVLLAAIVVLGVYLYRRFTSHTTTSAPVSQNALEILKVRYAQGEIDSDEFQRRKQELQS